MKKILIIFLFTFAVFQLYSCNDSNSNIIGNPDGQFMGEIVLLDSLGANPLNGTIKLTQTNNTDLIGSWILQNGQNGKLTGLINDMKVNINLNPDFVDKNTVLLGNFDGMSIKGQWYHSSIVGLDNKGTFVATGY